MLKYNIKDMKDGWLIGNFEPSILKTKNFEVGVLKHHKGQQWPDHYHNNVTEYNLLLKGKMYINDILINVNDIFVLKPKEIARPIFVEDCEILCIKVPSVIGDKVEVNK
tara:strand:+ start:99 stop:425 length:327 start_codon:yes stop_codon:yes gene_type:complete